MALRFGRSYTLKSKARRAICDCENDTFRIIMVNRNDHNTLFAQCTKCERAHEIAGY